MTQKLPQPPGRRTLITGGTRGLGLAIATALAAQGARVAITYATNDQDAAEASRKIAPSGARPLVFKGDVANPAHADAVLAELDAQWGGLDVLVNAAGLAQIQPIALIEEADWDRVMDVNVKGAWLFSRAALGSMLRAKRGHILNIGTFASERMLEVPVHFAAAKSALRGMTEAMAREVGRHGIQVNMLSPGLFDTGPGQLLPRSRVEEYLARCPLKRLGTAAELAQLAVFMVSNRNRFMSGAKLVADGGL